MSLYRQKGRNKWMMSYSVGGRRVQESTGTSDRKTAERVYQKRKLEVYEGKWFGKIKEVRTPLIEAIDLYMKTYAQDKKTSWQDDDAMLRRFRLTMEKEKGMAVAIQDITRMTIESFQAELRKTLSPARVNRHLSCIRTMFNKMIAWDKLKQNPVKGIKFYPENPRTRYLETGQVRELLNACPPKLKPVVMVAVLTGLRQGDILKLAWNDLDIHNRTIRVIQSKTKTPLSFHMPETLASMFQSMPRNPDSPYVFCVDGKRPQKGGWIRSSFQKALNEAGITGFQFRDLRRTFGTLQRLQGADLKLVMELMGHKSTRMTERYVCIPGSSKKQAVDALAEKIINGPSVQPANILLTSSET